MRKALILTAAIAASVATPASASVSASIARAHATLKPMYALCHVNRDSIAAATRDIQKGVSPDRTCRAFHTTAARVSNSTSGNCGTSYIYNNPANAIGYGWIQEWYGINLDWPVTGGGAIVPWYNYSTGGHNAYDQGWGPKFDGNENSEHNAYTHRGYVGSWLHASAVMVSPWSVTICTNYSREPWSFTFAS